MNMGLPLKIKDLVWPTCMVILVKGAKNCLNTLKYGTIYFAVRSWQRKSDFALL